MHNHLTQAVLEILAQNSGTAIFISMFMEMMISGMGSIARYRKNTQLSRRRKA